MSGVGSKRGRLRRFATRGEAGDARGAGSSRIASTMAVQLTGRMLAIIGSLVTLPLTARTLGADGFGIWNASLSYVSIFGAFTEFGLTNAALMKMSADPDREGEWLGALGSLRLILSFGMTLLALAIVPLALSSGNDSRTTSFILCLTILPNGSYALMSVFQARLRPAIPALITILQTVLWLGIVLFLAAIDAPPHLFAVGNLGMLVIISALQVGAVRKLAGASWRGPQVRARWRGLVAIGLPVGLANIFVVAYYKLDSVLLLEIGNAHEAGIYGAAYRFLDPMLVFPTAAMTAFFPVITAHYANNKPRARELVQGAAEYMVVLSLPAFATTLALSGPIVHLLLGDAFAESADVLPILFSAFVFICFGSLAGYLAPLLGLQWKITLFAAIGAAINIALNVLLIPRYGAHGSAWATTATEATAMSLTLVTCLRVLHQRLHPGKMLRTVVAAAAMLGLMLLLRPAGLVPALIGGLLLYVGALFALRIVSLEELRRLRAGDPMTPQTTRR